MSSSEQQPQPQQQMQILKNSYAELLADKQELEKSLNDTQGINQTYDDSMLYVEQNRSHYILWSAAAIFVTFYMFKALLFPNTETNIFRMLFWFLFIILFLLSGLNMDQAIGFLIVGLFLILFVLIQMNMIPSP